MGNPTFGMNTHATEIPAEPRLVLGTAVGRHYARMSGGPGQIPLIFNLQAEESPIPPTPTYPGVYMEEVPGGVRPIEGVPTSITAFIGRAERGPIDMPVRTQSLAEYDQRFGGLWADSMMSFSVRHFFGNGGTDAVIVRIHNGGVAATFTLSGQTGTLILEAANPGSWADNLEIEIDHQTQNPGDDASFNLAIQEVVDGKTITEEVFHDLSTRPDDDRWVKRILEQESDLVRVRGDTDVDALTWTAAQAYCRERKW